MWETLGEWDKNLFVYLNNLGSEQYDPLWLLITKQTSWIPLFILLFYLVYNKLGRKQSLYLLFFVAVLIAFTDQLANVSKNHFQRLRPCNNAEIICIRKVLVRNSFSFFSGHAANTMAVTVFLFNTLRHYFKYFVLLFLWPLIFAYSRIYLGLHYPSDIVFGYFVGALNGVIFYKIYQSAQRKYFTI